MSIQITQTLCYLCPFCPNEFTPYSLQRSLETLNQHIARRHGQESRLVSGENVRRLFATQSGPNASFKANAVEIVKNSNFRCMSLFEQRSMILEQSLSIEVCLINPPEMQTLFPAIKEKMPRFKECVDMLMEGEKIAKNPWSDFLRHSMALDERGCASSRAWVPVHCKSTVEHYASTLAAFAFFCYKIDACEYPSSMPVPDMFFKVLCETKTGLTHEFIAKKFMTFSYICMGRGSRSKQPSFVSQEAVALLYALKVAYLVFCSKLPDNRNSVESSVTMAKQLLNQASDLETTFKAIKRIKNQAKSCIASWSSTPITWVQGPDLYASLTIDTVKGKHAVSHCDLANVYARLMNETSETFSKLKIPDLSEGDFELLKDVSTTFSNEGLASLNCNLFQLSTQEGLFQNIVRCNKLQEFLTECSDIGLNLLCAMHLAGGPGARASEECFLTVRNTVSCNRHVRMLGLSMVVIHDYCKQRKMSYKQPNLVVKFLPRGLGVAIARYIIFVKELEARVVSHVMKNSDYGETTRTFFCTTFGQTHDPEKFSSVLSGKFGQHGLSLNLHDLRHVLEAFARKITKTPAIASTLLRTANHSVSSSSSYGRSNEHAEFVDADVCEEDQTMCHIWNFKVLKQTQNAILSETSLRTSPTTVARKRQKLMEEPNSCQLVPLQLFLPPPLAPWKNQFPQSAETTTMVALRPMQEQACEFIGVSNANAILIMPTGSGKTRIIQQMMRDTHCDIVLSPYTLLSEQLAETLGGCRYPCLQSNQHIAASARCIICAYDIVHVNSPLIGLVQTLDTIGRLGSVWFDEAHCLITRGEFRSKFAEVWTFAVQLAKINIRPRFIALTATLRPSDVDDLCSRMGICNVSVMRFSCIRSDIHLELRKFAHKNTAHDALIAWTHKHQEQYLLILCTSIADATTLSLELECPMSASTTSQQDDTLIARFRLRRCMVGTSRAGTGLNLHEISRVALYGHPFSAEHIVQSTGRIRGEGTAALFYFKEGQRSTYDDVGKCIAHSRCGAELLDSLYKLIDGRDAISADCKDVIGLKAAKFSHGVTSTNSASVLTRLCRLKQRLAILQVKFDTSMMSACCKVCYILTGRRALHEIPSCQRIFNICLHCFEFHQSKSCPRLPRLGRMCYKCFLPLDPAGGISFHDGPSGKLCDNVCCNMLKPLCMLIFAKRLSLPNNYSDGDFFVWLLQRSEHIPNVLRVLEYAFSLKPDITK